MLIVHLFVSYAHVNLCHCFSYSCCQGLAATSACGCSWTFLFTFLRAKPILSSERKWRHNLGMLSRNGLTYRTNMYLATELNYSSS